MLYYSQCTIISRISYFSLVYVVKGIFRCLYIISNLLASHEKIHFIGAFTFHYAQCTVNSRISYFSFVYVVKGIFRCSYFNFLNCILIWMLLTFLGRESRHLWHVDPSILPFMIGTSFHFAWCDERDLLEESHHARSLATSRGIMHFRQGVSSLNETFITLIPKKENFPHANQFHPISLCNFIYKIITTVISI